jgi:hypothetical protein
VVLAPLLIAALAAPSPSLPDAEVRERAEAAFAAGVRLRGDPQAAWPLFREAAGLYAELHRRGASNPALFRNEGNAWLLGGDLSRAILAYRRGLRLDPTDRDLRDALEYARGQVNHATTGGFGRPPRDDRPPWLPRVGLATWSFYLLLTLYAISCVLLTRWLMTRRPRLLSLGLAVLLVTAAAATLLTLTTAWENRGNEHALVVVARDGVLLRKGNGPDYPPRSEAPLNRGVEARLLYRRGGWLQVELAGGEVGWLPASAALVDGDTDSD